jgi:DNA-binding CsgD family transcriptional regulator
VKPYRIKAKIQNNRLWKAITDIYPDVKTQADAARKIGMSQQILGSLLNMKRWPARSFGGQIWWTKLAWQVSEALAYHPEYLFDPIYYGKHIVDAPKMIELEAGLAEIERKGSELLPPPTEKIVTDLNLAEYAEHLLAQLSPREELVAKMNAEKKTLEEIGEKLGISRERARQLILKVERKFQMLNEGLAIDRESYKRWNWQRREREKGTNRPYRFGLEK